MQTFANTNGDGNNDVQRVRVMVDPRIREVFSYPPVILPANRVAVPAP